MKIGISNIGWSEDYSKIAFELGFDYIESAFVKIPKIKPVLALQSLFFGSNIDTFEEKDITYNTLKKIIQQCPAEVEVLTVGSPSMRRGKLAKKAMLEALEAAAKLAPNLKICIEPNAHKYQGEFFFTLDEIVTELPVNVFTMIDTGNLELENCDVFKTYESYKSVIKHIHFSTTNLRAIKDYGFYRELFYFLKNNLYEGLITYELIEHEMAIEDQMTNFLHGINL